MQFTNLQLAKILRNVAASYTIKKIGNIFQIRAYENAADSIEHSTSEIYDLWQEGSIQKVPALGKGIINYLDELFKTGEVKHFEDVQKGLSPIIFDLLDIPGVGPKTASEIANLGIKSIDVLKKQIKNGELVKKGFSGKTAQRIMHGINEVSSRSGRMLLPYAFAQAEKITQYLKTCPLALEINTLGSLRRMVATIGDLDFGVSSNKPQEVVEFFCKMPYVFRILDKGKQKASVILKTRIKADLLVGKPSSYGALLQHFTGSKSHNIKLRSLANQKGYSLSEYGVRKVKNEELVEIKTEEGFYKLLGMQTPPPEVREDTGEIEASLNHQLPNLVTTKDINGDLHLHSNFPLEKPSHASGVNSIEEIIKKAQDLDYSFVGISDHPPSFNLNKEIIIRSIEKRTKFIQSLNKNTNSIRVLNGLEIDILGNGSLSVPDEALSTLDYCIAGIHSGHRDSKEQITQRLLSALSNQHVDIISHPTNRLLNERESSDADWDEVFRMAAKNNKLLEINSYPNRLDLRDDLVRSALRYGVKFIIDTDAHEVTQMDNMRFGVAVSRRGWATKKDIINTWDWKKFSKWFNIKT